MEDITPEQKKQLGTWAVQRDEILKSISDKREEERILTESVNNLSQTKSDIHDEIQRSIGRLEELKKKEEEFALLTTNENALLREEKSVLQTEIVGHQNELVLLKENKAEIVESVGTLTALFEKLFDKTSGLESLIGGIVRVASENATDIKNILITAGAELQKVIDIGERNVEKTNKVLLDIPKIVVDLHRDIINRKMIARNRMASEELNEKPE